MNLRELRNQKDLSLRELAQSIGIPPSRLQAIETGQESTAGNQALHAKIAKALGVSLLEAVRACRLSAEQQPVKEPEGPSVTISCGPNGCKVTRFK